MCLIQHSTSRTELKSCFLNVSWLMRWYTLRPPRSSVCEGLLYKRTEWFTTQTISRNLFHIQKESSNCLLVSINLAFASFVILAFLHYIVNPLCEFCYSRISTRWVPLSTSSTPTLQWFSNITSKNRFNHIILTTHFDESRLSKFA